jgi:oleandomycin transport system ATP-binding protein
VLGVLGPNGAGKTTAVRILGTLLRPDAGHATVGWYDVVRDAPRVRELIGLTGQYASVDEDMSGRRNLVMIGRLLGHRPRPGRTNCWSGSSWSRSATGSPRPTQAACAGGST